jgi:hypothetical protein
MNKPTAAPGEDRMTEEETCDRDTHDAMVTAAAPECIELAVRHLGSMTAVSAPAQNRTAALIGYGWWVRVVRSADAVAVLSRFGFGHEAGGLVRTVLHHAAALCWLVNEPEQALQALWYEGALRRHKIAKGARDRGWDLGKTEDFPKPDQKPPGVVYLNEVEKLCDHVGLRNFYIPYREESGYFHPSLASAIAYVDGDEVDGSLALRNAPPTPDVDLAATAACVGLATSALWKVTEDDGLEGLVEELAHRLQLDLSVPAVAGAEDEAEPQGSD